MTTDDYDSPWKTAIEGHFPDFMAFYFPDAHAQIDWTHGYTFLNTELQAVVQDAELGQRRVDKLVKVHDLSGEEGWIYIHLEVQSRAQHTFAERMFVYHYRLYDRYRRPIASMALLADTTATWRPETFNRTALGCDITMRFPVAKLLDWIGREAELEAANNPFALVTLAHLQTQATRLDAQARYRAKLHLIRLLYGKGWTKQQIIDLFTVIDWMMRLPPELNQQLRQQVYAMEEEQRMRYVTSFEQMAREEGREEGREETVRETACNLLRLGMLNAAQIAQVTGLTLAQVSALEKRGDVSSADPD